MSVAIQHIDLGLNPLPADVMRSLAEDFASQAAAKVSGAESTLAMYPSHISQGSLPQGEFTVLAIDIGGSFIRAGLFTAVAGNLTPYGAKPHDSLEYKGVTIALEEYSKVLTSFVSRFLEDNGRPNLNAVGLVFSYPAKIIRQGEHIDATREGLGSEWGKGFIVSGSDCNVSEYFRNAFAKAGINAPFWATMNDVVSLLIAHEHSGISFIVGTGYNLGVTDKSGVVFNTEAGFYSSELFTKFTSKVAKRYMRESAETLARMDVDPGHSVQLRKKTELQIGGKYIYPLFITALCMLGDCDADTAMAISKLQGHALSLAINRDSKEFESVTGLALPEHRLEYMHEIACLLRDRAADIIAFQLAGAAMFGEHKESVQIAADGGVTMNLPGFTDRISQRVSEISGCYCKVERIEDSGLKGAARGALLAIKGQESTAVTQ